MVILKFLFFFFLFGNRFTVLNVQLWFLFAIIIILIKRPLFFKSNLRAYLLIPLIVIHSSVIFNLISIFEFYGYIMRFSASNIYYITIIAIVGAFRWSSKDFKILLASITLLLLFSILDWIMLTFHWREYGLVQFLPTFFDSINEEVDYYGVAGAKLYRLNFFYSDPSVGALVYLVGIVINDSISKIKYLSLLFLFGVILFMSGSVSLLAVLYFLLKFNFRNFKYYLSFFIFLVLLINYYDFGNLLVDLISYKYNPDYSLSSHAETNKFAFSDISFFGHGFLTFDYYFPDVGSAHNTLLSFLFDTGIFGTTLMIIFYSRITLKCLTLSNVSIVVNILLFLGSFAHNILFRYEFVFVMIILNIFTLHYQKSTY